MADPPAGHRRASTSRRAKPARRQRREPAGTATPLEDPPAAATRVPRWPWLRLGWLVLLVAGVVGLVTGQVVARTPDLVGEVAAGVVSMLLASGLAWRTGGRHWWALALCTLLVVAAFTTGWVPLLGGAAVGTAVLAGTLAVMATQPAATFGLAIREVLLASVVAAVGALAVEEYVGDEVRLDVVRFGYVVLGLALLGALALVYRLGAGLHGLGRRGYVLAGLVVLTLAIALAYSEALSRWGSPELIDFVEGFRTSFREHLRAVPHPIAALLGYPALVWGVFMRARRRQGWWVCAFGVAATASEATRLVDPGVALHTTLLSALYSLVVGLTFGYLAIRVEQSITGSHGRRARRSEEAAALRPEPGRFSPLH